MASPLPQPPAGASRREPPAHGPQPVPRRIAVIANPGSGRNARDAAAVESALSVFDGSARLYRWTPGEDLSALIDKAIGEGAEIVIAAGGDGTAMAVAGAMLGRDVPFSVLPLGTFNFFARGLDLSEDPVEAARQIAGARPHRIRVGKVNGHVFLNNASLGIYPSILKARETVYRRFGRWRAAAHWSVIKTFLRFQRPMVMTITADGRILHRTTALAFIARSAYQLDFFGLEGTEAIHEDAFALLIARAESRRDLFRLAWRLAVRKVHRGRDYEVIQAAEITIETRRRKTLVAFDGEKCRERSPFRFTMSDEPLTILIPQARAS